MPPQGSPLETIFPFVLSKANLLIINGSLVQPFFALMMAFLLLYGT
jgi:hypothetical protein